MGYRPTRWFHGFSVFVRMSRCPAACSYTYALSTLQFFVSPKIGALSDKYGRKPILLLTMVGNILSALMYVPSKPMFTTHPSRFQLDKVHHICFLYAFARDRRIERSKCPARTVRLRHFSTTRPCSLTRKFHYIRRDDG